MLKLLKTLLVAAMLVVAPVSAAQQIGFAQEDREAMLAAGWVQRGEGTFFRYDAEKDVTYVRTGKGGKSKLWLQAVTPGDGSSWKEVKPAAAESVDWLN